MKLVLVLFILLIGGYLALKKYKPGLLLGEPLPEEDKTLRPSGGVTPGLQPELGIRTMFIPRDTRVGARELINPSLE